MINKKLMILALSTTFISSTIYASGTDLPVQTNPASITLGDVNNPAVALKGTYSSPNTTTSSGSFVVNTANIAGMGDIYNRDLQQTFDPIKFLLNLEQNFYGLYDSRGPRGYKINGKYYPSIFAVLKDVNISGFPNNDQIKSIIQNIGRQIPDDQAYLIEETLMQEQLKILTVQAQTDSGALQSLQLQLNNLANNAGSNFSDLQSIQTPDTLSTDTLLYSTSDLITDLLEARMDTFDAGLVGVASGDLLQSTGVWVKGTMSMAKQKEIKLLPEYKINQQGITIGADIGEDDLVGVAYSMIRSKVKHTNMTEKATNYIGAIYGLYNFSDNIFVNGQLKYGRATIKKQRNTRDFANHIASGKTKGELLGGRVELGYYYNFMEGSQLIPSIGFSYDTVKIKKYKETGLGANRIIGKRKGDKAAVTAGLMVNRAVDLKTFTLIPEVHANIIYTVKRKNDRTAITFLEGMDPVYVASGKPPKTGYKLGGSLKACKLQNLELSLGYDLGLAKKFYSHSGYIQARVDF